MARQRANPPTPTPVRVSAPSGAAGVVAPTNEPDATPTARKRKPVRAHTAKVRAQSKQAKGAKPRRKRKPDEPAAPVGRPPFVLSEEMGEQVRACAGFGLTNEQIAVVCGISPTTFYEHREQFAEHLEAGRAIAVGWWLGRDGDTGSTENPRFVSLPVDPYTQSLAVRRRRRRVHLRR